MSGIKLKAKCKNTDDWLLFGITELFHGENGYFQVCVEDVGLFAIDPATIQPADDPRKQMLDDIRKGVLGVIENKRDDHQDAWLFFADIGKILDEMEAKL